jgi:hypothetical protein
MNFFLKNFKKVMEEKLERIVCMSQCFCNHRNERTRVFKSYFNLSCCFLKIFKNFGKQRGRNYKLKKRIEKLSYFLLENDKYENENIYIERTNYLKDILEVMNFFYEHTCKKEKIYDLNVNKTFLKDYF